MKYIKRSISIGLVLSLLATSTPAAPQAIVSLTRESKASFAFWFHASGWRKTITNLIQGREQNASKQEKQRDRDALITRIQIFPGDVTIDLSDHVQFSAISYDAEDSPVGGVKIKWSAQDTVSRRHARITPHGNFEAMTPGTFRVTAEGAGRTANATVVVRSSPRRNPNLVPLKTREVSTRNLPPAATTKTQNQPASIAQGSKRDAKQSKRSGSRMRAHTRTARATVAPPLLDDGWGDSNHWSADDPGNRVGDTPGSPIDQGAGSGNFQFAAPVLQLPGRGIEISLSLAYNSRLWNKAGTQISFDNDRGWPAPGWTLGFSKLLGMGVFNGGMLVEADGSRHSYIGNITEFPWGTTFVGHTTDGTFIDYTYTSGTGGSIVSAQAKLSNGTVINFGAPGPGAVYPTSIVDANGNFIIITYVNNAGPRIQTITDTLNRAINFHYDTNNLLTAITSPGLNGGTREAVRIHYRQLTLNTTNAFSGLTPVVRDPNLWVIDAIYYPGTNTGFWFGETDSYSSYGMLAKVIEQRGIGFSASSLNDQGTVTPGSITRSAVYNYPLTNSSLTEAPTYTEVVESWSRDGTNFDFATTLYEVHENTTPRTTTITFPNGTKTKQYSFNYTNLPANDPLKALDGVVYRDETYVIPTEILHSTNSTWERGAYESPRPTRMEKTNERGQMTATEYSYGSVYNQVTEVRDFDFGGTALIRATRSQYQNSANYTNRHIFNLPLFAEVYASDNVTRVSRTDYQYDGQTLTDAPDVVMHDYSHNPYAPLYEVCECAQWDHWQIECLQWNCFWRSDYIAATDYRGNVTQVTSYADAAGLTGAVTETRRYDITGNMVTTSTSCCQQTSNSFTIDTQYAYPQSQTRGSATDAYKQVKTSATYNFNTGLMLSATDANGRVSEITYSAVTLRPTSSISPTGAHIDYAYNDVEMSVTTTTYLAPGVTGPITDESTKIFNGRGQVRHEKARGPDNGQQQTWDAIDSVFNNLGLVTQQSRPYRLGVGSPVFTVTTYDALGRAKTVTAPDGSVSESFYNETTRPDVASTAPGEHTRVRDPWGRERWGRTDASGRLVEIVEPNPSGSGSVATGGLVTTYVYSTLGYMTQINQGAQTRSFAYDALGRLVAQKLAEQDATLNAAGTYVGAGGQWGEVFTYDDRSNLTSRTDARGVKTVFDYGTDPLNRLQNVSYDTSGFGDTANPILSAATVTYAYRQKGSPTELKDITQLETITTAGISTETLGFDTEGRVSSRALTLNSRPGHPFVTDYIHDTLDRVTDIHYPAEYGNGSAPRKIVHHDYDLASRLTGLTFGGQSFASNITYNPASQTTSVNVGTGGNQITESYNYSTQTGLLDGQTVARGATTLLNLSYEYTNANGKRSGQLTKILNNLNHNKDRAYSYDAVGRLIQATGGVNGALWSQTYTYDRYGNRTAVTASGFSARGGSPIPTDESVVAQTERERSQPVSGFVGVAEILSEMQGEGIGETAAAETQNLTAQQPAVPKPAQDKRSHHTSRSTRKFAGASTGPQGTPVFTDDPLTPGIVIKAVHVTELRDAINQARARAGLSSASWAESVTVGIVVKASHITEMRARLAEARTALGLSAATYTDPGLTSGDTIKAVHIQELRQRTIETITANLAIPTDGHSSVSYNTSSNRITTAGFAYDAAGNQVRALIPGGTGSQRYQYDAANRLVKVKADNNTTVLATYTYGDSNERLIAEEGSTRTYYVSEGGPIIAEYIETGGSTTPGWSKSYLYLGARLLSIVTPNGSGGELVEYHHPDRLGTRLVTNPATGTSFEQVTLPFGTALGAESTGTTTRRFTSYERSTTSGLDYAVNRQYDPQQGRFTQVDPIGMKSTNPTNPQSLNLYAYCTNDPINHTDPDGLGFLSWLKKAFKKLGRFFSKVGAAISRILNNRWVRIGVFILGFIVPGLQLISETLANIVSTAINIYNYVADIASQLQLWGSLMQGNWREFGASIGLAIGGAALSTFIDPIVSGFQTALFRGENVLKGAWQGLLDGYNNFADAFSRELKNIFIPFYGLYGGPGHPEKEAFDEKTGKFDPDHKGINAVDEAYKEHDAIGRQLETLRKNNVINSFEKKTMRRWSDRKLFRRLLRSAPTVHLLDIAFSGQFGGRPMIGSGSKFLSLPLFGIRGYVFR